MKHAPIKAGDIFLLYKYEDEPELFAITKKYMTGTEYKYFYHAIPLVGGDEYDGIFWEDSPIARGLMLANKNKIIKIVFGGPII